MRVFRSIGLGILCAALVIIAFWLRPSEPLPDGIKADQILVLKAQRRLVLLKGDTPLKSYGVALGRNPKGPKDRQGDGRTPEGSYRIDFRKASDFHLALHISYPNAEDSKRAQQLGVSPGGVIMVHGMKNGYGWIGNLHRLVDWTDGCIAVTNREIEEIWRAVPDGIRTRAALKPRRRGSAASCAGAWRPVSIKPPRKIARRSPASCAASATDRRRLRSRIARSTT